MIWLSVVRCLEKRETANHGRGDRHRGGWVTDHELFSDLMAVLQYSLPAEQTCDLTRQRADAASLIARFRALPRQTVEAEPDHDVLFQEAGDLSSSLKKEAG